MWKTLKTLGFQGFARQQQVSQNMHSFLYGKALILEFHNL